MKKCSLEIYNTNCAIKITVNSMDNTLSSIFTIQIVLLKFFSLCDIKSFEFNIYNTNCAIKIVRHSI